MKIERWNTNEQMNRRVGALALCEITTPPPPPPPASLVSNNTPGPSKALDSHRIPWFGHFPFLLLTARIHIISGGQNSGGRRSR